MRRWLALVGVLVATPAVAQSEALLDCPAVELSVAFRDKLTDAAFAPESSETEALFAELVRASDACAAKYGLPKDKWEPYYDYATARLLRDSLLLRLGKAGLPATVIDSAFGFGEGQANPVLKGGLTAEQTAALIGALSAGGVDVEKVADATWQLVGSYAGATSNLWQARAALR